MAEPSTFDREYWNSRAEAWDKREGTLERFLEDLGRAGIAALAPAPGERVLDIGCGPGATTIELANRVGRGGEAVGLDIAEAMVAAASRRATGAGVDNARFVVHDLEQAPTSQAFDAAYSRFGVMFFSAPELAFANVVASLRPGGRSAFVVWADIDENPWMSSTNLVAARALGLDLAPPTASGPGPFSLSDPVHLRSLLEAGGLVDVVLTPVRGHVEIAPEVASFEIASILESGRCGEAFGACDRQGRELVVAAVLDAIEPFRAGAGWALPGCALVASGARPA